MNLGTPLIELDVIDLVIAIALGTVYSIALAYQYVLHGHTFSNRSNLARTIPLITITIIIIIAVVKSSLALSLGLVGALSIVRFRTPIKEPEELAYLFMAIAIGISLGANQILAASVGMVAFLIYSVARHYVRKTPEKRNLFIHIAVPAKNNQDKIELSSLVEILSGTVNHVNLRRVDLQGADTEASFYIEVPNDRALVESLSSIRSQLPENSSVTFVDQDNSLG